MELYEKLDKTENEDIEKVREYAKARMELRALEARVDFLENLVDDNAELSASVWTTETGNTIAIHDLEDSHLKNIVTHLQKRGKGDQRIAKEYMKRFNETPKLLEANDWEF